MIKMSTEAPTRLQTQTAAIAALGRPPALFVAAGVDVELAEKCEFTTEVCTGRTMLLKDALTSAEEVADIDDRTAAGRTEVRDALGKESSDWLPVFGESVVDIGS